VGISTAVYIDKHGLTKALQSAIIKWITSLKKQLKLTDDTSKMKLMIDGNHDFGLRKKMNCEVETIIKWDDKIPAISAASLVAKVTRDVYMRLQHHIYPQYEFATHKGYGTKMHYERLATYGPCPLHRKSFLHTTLDKNPPKKIIKKWKK
jgi:ribonuclease HII